MLYYADTMQAKAMKLMASKLAVAGIIEGTFSEEGLAAMSDVKDLTSQMAKELAAGHPGQCGGYCRGLSENGGHQPRAEKERRRQRQTWKARLPRQVVTEGARSRGFLQRPHGAGCKRGLGTL